jgi:hypothetical protein
MSGITEMTGLLALLIFGVPVGMAGEAPVTLTCATSAECGALGSIALKEGRVEEAYRLFEQQVEFAETANSKALALLGYNNLAVASLHKNDHLRALAWTRLTLEMDPENKAARYNRSVIETKLKELSWPTSVSGNYVHYAGWAHWNTLSVEQRSDQKIEIHFIGIRLNSEWRKNGPSAIGELRGVAAINGSAATFRTKEFSEPCRIDMQFSKEKAVLTQAGDCGFGYGVYAEGEYQRASFAPNH